jgi:hypothetical protein
MFVIFEEIVVYKKKFAIVDPVLKFTPDVLPFSNCVPLEKIGNIDINTIFATAKMSFLGNVICHFVIRCFRAPFG